MIQVAILTVSDSVAKGTREDRSGLNLKQRAEALGWQVRNVGVASDDVEDIAAKLTSWADGGTVDVILTTGGTGIAIRDVTPEATRAVMDREVPGIGEIMRSEGRKVTRLAPLSRSMAGTRGTVVIVNLPGSPKGAVESLDAIADLIPHMVDLLHGKTEHAPVGN
jgi:molybdenum cofactor synthesis domain-containing protein